MKRRAIPPPAMVKQIKETLCPCTTNFWQPTVGRAVILAGSVPIGAFRSFSHAAILSRSDEVIPSAGALLLSRGRMAAAYSVRGRGANAQVGLATPARGSIAPAV